MRETLSKSSRCATLLASTSFRVRGIPEYPSSTCSHAWHSWQYHRGHHDHRPSNLGSTAQGCASLGFGWEGWPCEHDWLRPRYASNAHILLLALFFSQLNSHVLVVGHVLGRVLIWLLLYGSRLAQCRSSTVQVKFVLCHDSGLCN